MEILARYGVPDPKRSVFELFLTAVPFFLLWALMLYCLESYGYWACLPLALPAAGFLVRLFMIQHDCGHGSFFHRGPGQVELQPGRAPLRELGKP